MCGEFGEVAVIIGLVINFLAFVSPFVGFRDTLSYRCDPSDQKLDQMICSIVHNYAASLHCIMGQTHTS